MNLVQARIEVGPHRRPVCAEVGQRGPNPLRATVYQCRTGSWSCWSLLR